MVDPRIRPTLLRFWQKVSRGSADSCWPWQASRTAFGHGKFYLRVGSRRQYTVAHRVMWMLAFGPIPMGMETCHRCDNPWCVNPRHLFLGTQQDNLRDMREKGREITDGNATLTRHQVHEIRVLLAAGLTHTAIAKQFQVARSTVTRISLGTAWKEAA